MTVSAISEMRFLPSEVEVPNELRAEFRDLDPCTASPSNTKVLYSERSDEVSDINTADKSYRYCADQSEPPRSETAQVVEEIIDDLKWSYAVMLEWQQGEPEEFHDLLARYKTVLVGYNEYPDFYSDGTPIGAKHLDLTCEWIGYKAIEPPHRRRVRETCCCTGQHWHRGDGGRQHGGESADQRAVVW